MQSVSAAEFHGVAGRLTTQAATDARGARVSVWSPPEQPPTAKEALARDTGASTVRLRIRPDWERFEPGDCGGQAREVEAIAAALRAGQPARCYVGSRNVRSAFGTRTENEFAEFRLGEVSEHMLRIGFWLAHQYPWLIEATDEAVRSVPPPAAEPIETNTPAPKGRKG